MNTTWQLTYSKLNASNRMNEKWHVQIMRLTKTSVEMFQRKTLSINATASVYASIGDVRRSRGLGALMAPELEKLSPLDQMVGGSDPAA